MTVKRGQIVFGCSLLATAVIAIAANAAPRCPSGTRETKQEISGGSSVEVNGAREGAYSEWAPSGKQRVWGWFEQDHEQGPWLLAYDKGGDAIGFVVFDSGVDVTTQMDSPPKTCAEWTKRTPPFRSGVVATAALEAACPTATAS